MLVSRYCNHNSSYSRQASSKTHYQKNGWVHETG